jgi:hypothetical protein
MAHRWRNLLCAITDWRLRKKQWRQGCANYLFPMARQWRNGERSRLIISILDSSMARAPSTFRQQDVTRAVKAVTAAGVHIARIEIDKAGKIVIITAETTDQQGEITEGNEWDRI